MFRQQIPEHINGFRSNKFIFSIGIKIEIKDAKLTEAYGVRLGPAHSLWERKREARQ